MLALPAVAGAAAPTSSHPQTTPTPARAAASAMLIGIDRETGRIGLPTPDQIARLTALRSKLATTASAHPAPVHHPDGRISLDVRSWMREYSVVRRAPDGRLVLGCADGAAAAKSLRLIPATHAGGEER